MTQLQRAHPATPGFSNFTYWSSLILDIANLLEAAYRGLLLSGTAGNITARARPKNRFPELNFPGLRCRNSLQGV